MANLESIVVLCGGIGAEREVSLISGDAIADALSKHYTVELIRLDGNYLPEDIDASKSIVFPALHGTFGEDGELQKLCESAGVIFCGSDAKSSRLCMSKDLAKAVANDVGIASPRGIVFDGETSPLADDVISELGRSLVVKPVAEGSSVGLHFTEHRSALGVILSNIHTGRWLIEKRVNGRELTVGVLNGKAMGIVEIVSASGVYNFEAKYSAGSTEYHFPAELPAAVETQIKDSAERLFAACGCRDFARIDFILDAEQSYLLEVNTLPGLTATSLLPKSASCIGLDFDALTVELVTPAIKRFQSKHGGNESS